MKRLPAARPLTFVAALALAGLLLAARLPLADASTPQAVGTSVPVAWLPLVNHGCGQPQPPADGHWLGTVNYYRALACLPAVAEEPAWSDGARKHANYMVVNDVITRGESRLLRGYTPEGDAAGRASNIAGTSSAATTDAQAIALWMRGPFHAIGILDPRLARVGFGSATDAGGAIGMAAALNVISGTVGAPIPSSIRFPVQWPANGKTVTLRSYQDSRIPNPVAMCGYTAPTGLPIILQLGSGNAISGATSPVTAHALKLGAATVESCRYDETSYVDADPNDGGDYTATGRDVLAARDAVVIMPRSPLTPGATYTASVTAGGVTHTWSFTVALGATSN